MTISKRDAKLLLILLGIVFLFVGYFAVYKPYTEKTEAATAETAALQPTLTELQGYEANLDVYRAGIEASRAAVVSGMAQFPNSVRTEDMIMYAIELEDKVGLDISSIAFAQPAVAASFDETLPDSESGEDVTKTYSAYQTSMNIAINLSYDGLKSLADHIAEAGKHTALDTVSVSFAADTAALTGTAIINKFYIAAGDEAYVPTDVPDVPLGTEDLFGTLEAAEALEAEEAAEAAGAAAE